MTPQETIKKYPRLAAILLSIAEETDVHWAASVLDAAKHRRTALTVGLVREAWHNRHAFRCKEATRRVDSFVGEVPHSTSSPEMRVA